MAQQKLTDELVETAIKKAFDAFERAGENYRKGYVSDEEFRQEMSKAFNRVFSDLFFLENQVLLELNETNYPQFSNEFLRYQ